MSDFDDAIGEMVEDLLAEAGQTVTYFRGVESHSVTARKAAGRTQFVDLGNGQIVEVRPVDWILLQADLPYPQPQAGDVILSAGLRYELQPFAGEKVFRQTSPQMVRLHSKMIGGVI